MRKINLLIIVVELAMFFVIAKELYSQDSAPKDSVPLGLEEKKSEKFLDPRKFYEGKSDLVDPFSLRDPFKAPILKKLEKKDTLTRQGEKPQELVLAETKVEDFDVVGIIIGDHRKALLRIKGNKEGAATYVVKEGDEIGTDKAVLKAILPGGIVLVETIQNVYGSEEYIETIMPLIK